MTDRFLPDKAIDVIDETGSMINVNRSSNKKIKIKKKDIETTISKITKIPEQSISSTDKKNLKAIESNLKRVIFGQDHAVETLSNAIKLSRVGLRDDNKTIGSFLFTGPTGVGKTEISKQLAEILGIDLIRFDMSEYMERHTVSRLIGAPPGYVGFDQGGLLTEAIVKSPNSVLLLDEIEKAHPDIFNILLQVMDAGVLTDNNGRKADFRNVILIMTTNVGAELLSKSSIGFNQNSNETDAMSALNRLFSPEFRNRLDETIQFDYLDRAVILSIVDKFLIKLQAQLDKRNVEINASSKVINWIADNGYDKEMGARPMERFIAKNIKKPLVDKLLFGSLKTGGIIKLDIKNDKLVFLDTKKTEKV
jgi:ATP-dependent Clp protease ATP-binding subunit ClpA